MAIARDTGLIKKRNDILLSLEKEPRNVFLLNELDNINRLIREDTKKFLLNYKKENEEM